jgi:hypothetical protein
MKKALIGMAVGAMALGTSVVPVAAGNPLGSSIWDGISGAGQGSFCQDANDDIFEALVLIGGWATKLDTDGNGEARYTVFQPYDVVLSGLLDALGLEISDLNAQPALVQSILADHIANGSFDPNELGDTDLTRITMRSGFVASIYGPGEQLGGPRVVPGNTFIAGAQITAGYQYGNGWLYCILGVIDSTPQVTHEGLNSQDTPNDGTPGGTNSLPDTL